MPTTISVVIPVYNSARMLRTCLENLSASIVKPLEVIVVDDGSTDTSVQVAREFGATIVSTGGRWGPAKARNLGTRKANGEVVYFVDADVCVYPESVGLVQANFDDDPELTALMGSYDDAPGSKDFLSQYRNLMHCYVHQNAKREASTFWSGCGAIRRETFLEFGGFDESYERPAIEDIELGYRLSRAGKKIVLDRDLQVKHLKRWTFWGVVKTDIFDRGIPWTELILRDRFLPNDLNLQISQRISVALVFIIMGMAMFLSIYWRGYFLTPLFTVLFFLLSRYWLEAISGPKPKAVTASLVGVVCAIAALSYWSHMLGLIPLVVVGSLILFLRHRYAASHMPTLQRTGIVIGAFVVLTIVVALVYLPYSWMAFAFIFLLLALIVINNQFYVFLASTRGKLFALAAIPFHVLYHFYNGISFMVGFLRHTLNTEKVSAPTPSERAIRR